MDANIFIQEAHSIPLLLSHPGVNRPLQSHPPNMMQCTASGPNQYGQMTIETPEIKNQNKPLFLQVVYFRYFVTVIAN